MKKTERKALLIVDVQNDFCPGGAASVARGDSVVGPLNRMIEYANRNGWLVLASRDWHPAITSHFANYGGLWPVHCVQNSKGAEFHPDLKVKDAIIISKATRPNENGYSPFEGRTDAGQSLEEILKKNNVVEIYIGGLATDYCVKAAALDAVKKRLTFLLLDACRAVNLKADDGKKAVEEMWLAEVIITTTKAVING